MATPTAKVQICNFALSHLKSGRILSIEPPDKDSPPASACEKWYDQARRHVLEDHPWKFASKRLLINADATAPDFEYSKQYELPADYIRLNRIGEDWDDPVQDYEIEGTFILCNEPAPLKIIYNRNITDVSKFSPQFVTALSYKLAELMCYELTGKDAYKFKLREEYDNVCASAESINGQNRPTRRIQRSKFAAARKSFSRGRDLTRAH